MWWFFLINKSLVWSTHSGHSYLCAVFAQHTSSAVNYYSVSRWAVEVAPIVSLTNATPAAHHCCCGPTSLEPSSAAEGKWRPHRLLNEQYIPECLNCGNMTANLWGKQESTQICTDKPLIMLCLQCDIIFSMALGTQSSNIWSWDFKNIRPSHDI